jgi:hypothetical protein
MFRNQDCKQKCIKGFKGSRFNVQGCLYFRLLTNVKPYLRIFMLTGYASITQLEPERVGNSNPEHSNQNPER